MYTCIPPDDVANQTPIFLDGSLNFILIWYWMQPGRTQDSIAQRRRRPLVTLAAGEGTRVIMFLVHDYCRVYMGFDGLYQMLCPLPIIISDHRCDISWVFRIQGVDETFPRSKSQLPLMYEVFLR